VASLRDALKHGNKSLVGNKGYRKFLQSGGKQFTVDEDKLKQEARYDGKWVLTTNTDLAQRKCVEVQTTVASRGWSSAR